jgi:selenocysteine-specific elongation factor
MKNVIVGTAGHIDHGKSALVEALTGTHPDRLEEEKRRGITIDLGFAFLQHDDVSIGLVDVPGHERFVRNMLSGVGGIDIILLVIAADEGIKPQTREHFDICRLLEISRGLVALTKSDLVDADTLALRQIEVEDYLRDSFMAGAPIVPVNSLGRSGIDALKNELARIAHAVPARNSSSHFRLPVDRVFAMKGFGTVVTGTLLSGSVAVEDNLEAFPGGHRFRVRGLQSGGQTVNTAAAGQRTALNLAGDNLDQLQRGTVLTVPGFFTATRKIDVRITLLHSHSKPLKNRARVHFHQGTSETIAEVILLDRAQLTPGDTGFAQIPLQDEIFALPGDRFIVRQFSPVTTIGGGVILDTCARRHSPRDPAVLKFLSTAQDGDRSEILAALLRSAPDALDMNSVIGRTGWSGDEVAAAAQVLASRGVVRILPPHARAYALTERLDACSGAIREAVTQFHAKNPLAEGMPLQSLRAAIARRRAVTFDAALQQLIAAKELAPSGELIKGATHSISLQPAEIQARDRIAAAFETAGLAVPAADEVLAGVALDSQRAQKLLQILLRENVLIKLGDGLIFHHTALAKLRQLVAVRKKTKGPRFKVPEFKEMAGVSRKYAIPLLEYLDRNGVTQRMGDERVIL